MRHIAATALILAFCIVGPSAAYELEPFAGGRDAGDFTLTDLDGRMHRLSDYTGRVVIVSFWATWCPECVYEIPFLQTLYDTLPKESFVVLAINVGEEPRRVRRFANENDVTLPILLDHEMSTYTKWPVLGVPTSFIVDRQGIIRYWAVGTIEWVSQANLAWIRALSDPD